MSALPAAVKWAQKHPDFRYLVDVDLIGWIWPWAHKQLVERLEQRHPKRAAVIRPFILPVVPVESFEKPHPQYQAAKVAGLLV